MLAACVELDLPGQLAAGPLSLAVLAPRMGMSEAAAHRLLRAAVAIDILERRGHTAPGSPRFGLGAHGAAMLAQTGFERIRLVRTRRPMQARLLVAQAGLPVA